MPADRISLRDLRKLARGALGGGGGVVESEPFEGEWQCMAGNKHYSTFAFATSKWDARRQLRDLLQSIVAGQMAGEGCTLHGDAPHGQEAEELRSGIEALIRSGPFRVDIYELQQLLDRVSARDSLAHVRARERAPRRRSTNGAGRKAT